MLNTKTKATGWPAVHMKQNHSSLIIRMLWKQ